MNVYMLFKHSYTFFRFFALLERAHRTGPPPSIYASGNTSPSGTPVKKLLSLLGWSYIKDIYFPANVLLQLLLQLKCKK